jgi:hypothetical protein
MRFKSLALMVRVEEGVAFFALEPGVDVDKGASRGDYDVTPEIQDLASIENGTYSFTYDLRVKVGLRMQANR